MLHFYIVALSPHLALEKNETSQRWMKDWSVQISSVPTQQCRTLTFSSSPRNFRQLSTEECQLSSTVRTSCCRRRCGKHDNTCYRNRRKNTTILATGKEEKTQQYLLQEQKPESSMKETLLPSGLLALASANSTVASSVCLLVVSRSISVYFSTI